MLPGSDFYFKDDEFFFRLAFVDFNEKNAIEAYKKQGLINGDFIKTYCPNVYLGTKALLRFVSKLKI